MVEFLDPKHDPKALAAKRQKHIDAYQSTVARIEEQFTDVVIVYLAEYARRIAVAAEQFLHASELAQRAFRDTEQPARAAYERSLEQAYKLEKQILGPARAQYDKAFAEARKVYEEGITPALDVRTQALADAAMALTTTTTAG